MEETKTITQKIVEQKAEQVKNAIEQAIDKGAKIKKSESYTSMLECCYINGVFLQKNTIDGSLAVVLHFDSDKITEVLAPSKDNLEKAAEIKRRELEEIEKQIKEKEEA